MFYPYCIRRNNICCLFANRLFNTHLHICVCVDHTSIILLLLVHQKYRVLLTPLEVWIVCVFVYVFRQALCTEDKYHNPHKVLLQASFTPADVVQVSPRY
jgi:hypothetical protein